MLEMERGIAGMITAASLAGIVLLTFTAPDGGAILLGAVIGFIFTFSVLAAVLKNSFIGGMATVVAFIGFGALLWRFPGPEFILVSGILGGCTVVAPYFVNSLPFIRSRKERL